MHRNQNVTLSRFGRDIRPEQKYPLHLPPGCAILLATHAPCRSLARVMHIKGAFFILRKPRTHGEPSDAHS